MLSTIRSFFQSQVLIDLGNIFFPPPFNYGRTNSTFNFQLSTLSRDRIQLSTLYTLIRQVLGGPRSKTPSASFCNKAAAAKTDTADGLGQRSIDPENMKMPKHGCQEQFWSKAVHLIHTQMIPITASPHPPHHH